jgi:hypothetical protein
LLVGLFGLYEPSPDVESPKLIWRHLNRTDFGILISFYMRVAQLLVSSNASASNWYHSTETLPVFTRGTFPIHLSELMIVLPAVCVCGKMPSPMTATLFTQVDQT